MTLKKFSSHIRCWASSDNSLSPNHTKNGCLDMPGHPLGMPNKVRELQLTKSHKPPMQRKTPIKRKIGITLGSKQLHSHDFLNWIQEVSTHINRAIARVGNCFSENPPFSQVWSLSHILMKAKWHNCLFHILGCLHSDHFCHNCYINLCIYYLPNNNCIQCSK